jgi:four helix bundle protein
MQEAYRLADKLPKHELYAMATQVRDASLSIPGNIAEGFGRYHKKDKINFYYFSRGSAYEIISHFLCATAVGYFMEKETEIVVRLCNEVIEDLNRIIKSLAGHV